MIEKEYFYIGYYVDIDGNFILKIGTTNDLKRRQTEHTRNYKRAKTHTMPTDSKFLYIWYKALSKYNTLRIEDRTREELRALGEGEFVRNDRFVYDTPPDFVEINIRKMYKIPIV
jgi:hypothetical protein